MGNVVIIGHVKSTILIEHPRWHISREVTYEIFSLIACVRVFTKQVVKALAENKWLVCIYPLLLPRGLYYYNEVQKRNPIHSILYTARQTLEVGLKLGCCCPECATCNTDIFIVTWTAALCNEGGC